MSRRPSGGMNRRNVGRLLSYGKAALSPLTVVAAGTNSSAAFPTISDLALRLEGDSGVATSGGLVTSWLDQSPNAFSCIPNTVAICTNATTFNGNKAVTFTGVADAFLYATSALTAFVGAGLDTFFVAAVFKNAATGAGGANGYDQPAIVASASNGFFYPLSADNTNITGGFYNGSNVDEIEQTAQAIGTLSYYETSLTAAAGGTLSLKIGTAGIPATSTGVGVIGSGSSAESYLYVGANYHNAKILKGDLCAVYVAKTKPSAGTLTALYAYINAKWGPGL